MQKYFVMLVVGAHLISGVVGNNVIAASHSNKDKFPGKTATVKLAAPNEKRVDAKSVPVKTVVPSKKIQKNTVSTGVLSVADIKKIIALEVERLVKDGDLTVKNEPSLSFEKLENLNRSYSDEKVGFQNYYIPAAAVSGVGTFLSASNVGAENLNGTNLTSQNAELDSLTVGGRALLEGGLSLAVPESGNVIDSDSGAYLSAGGTWTNASSKELKENIRAVDSADVLDKINALSIAQWNYKKENASTTHIGPLAEDFYAAFGLGGFSGQKSISTIDPAGVALAGVQAISKKFSNFEWLIEAAKKVGIIIEENVIKVKSFVATALQTDTLEVGSSSSPNGITLYDQTTKRPACVILDNGALHIQTGKCVPMPTVVLDPAIPEQNTLASEVFTEPADVATTTISAVPAESIVSYRPEVVVGPGETNNEANSGSNSVDVEGE